MMTYDPVRKTMVAMPPYGTLRPQTARPAEGAEIKGAQTADAKCEEDFFDHLLDVVNPLQHLPIIGSIYRAATGDQLGAVEKIAGDALYGGLWGAAAAVADVAFEAITGKSVENTVLAWFDDGDDTNTSLASIENTVMGWFDGKDAPTTMVAAASITPKQSLPSGELPSLPNIDVASASPDTLDILALTGAMSAKGVDGDTANRALYAYRRSMAITAPYTPVIASLN
jgi:hypothetical protein